MLSEFRSPGGPSEHLPWAGSFPPKRLEGHLLSSPFGGVPSVCPWFDGQLSFRAGGNPGGHRCLCSDTPKSVDTTPHDAISAQQTDDHPRMQCPLARLVWEMAPAHSAVPGVGLYPHPGEGGHANAQGRRQFRSLLAIFGNAFLICFSPRLQNKRS